ncbi:MAG: hypothetical protein RJQ09_21215 [Cyclobacteriaceae bacterium]
MERRYALLTAEKFAILTQVEASKFDVITQKTIGVDLEVSELKLTPKNQQEIAQVALSISGKEVEYLIDGKENEAIAILKHGIELYEKKLGNPKLTQDQIDKILNIL